jgi:mRNA interferase YafQ
VSREVVWSNGFKRDYKLVMKRGLDVGLLDDAIRILASGAALPAQYKDHALSGGWVGQRECHIQNNWLLIYRVDDDVLVLTLTRTGTHSALFRT